MSNLKDLPYGAEFTWSGFQGVLYLKVRVVDSTGACIHVLIVKDTNDPSRAGSFVGSFGSGDTEVTWINRPKVTFGEIEVGSKFKIDSIVYKKLDFYIRMPGYDGLAVDERVNTVRYLNNSAIVNAL